MDGVAVVSGGLIVDLCAGTPVKAHHLPRCVCACVYCHRNHHSPHMLPFDTMLWPIPMRERHDMAVFFSKRWVDVHPCCRWIHTLYAPDSDMEYVRRWLHASPLTVGYLSFDFNEHPTAYMAEAVFAHHDVNRVRARAFSYGHHDQSDVRNRTQQTLGSDFVDICEVGFADSAAVIAGEAVVRADDTTQVVAQHDDSLLPSTHVLMDMQSHTWGSRIEIVAARPSPIQVNFLVFPGTTGATFADYIIADKFVAPPHQQHSFSEKLVFMPATYQVNFYPASSVTRLHRRWLQAPVADNSVDSDDRRDLGLPGVGEGFVFANFNKNDKVDEATWDLWMKILVRVPGSVLWLLEPARAKANDIFRQQMLQQAMARGVAPRRLIFASRCPKPIHLARQRHADLFIDSLVVGDTIGSLVRRGLTDALQYGAHSTATDALRGALPVLTFQGESFPSYVCEESLGCNQNCCAGAGCTHFPYTSQSFLAPML